MDPFSVPSCSRSRGFLELCCVLPPSPTAPRRLRAIPESRGQTLPPGFPSHLCTLPAGTSLLRLLTHPPCPSSLTSLVSLLSPTAFVRFPHLPANRAHAMLRSRERGRCVRAGFSPVLRGRAHNDSQLVVRLIVFHPSSFEHVLSSVFSRRIDFFHYSRKKNLTVSKYSTSVTS